VDSRDVKLIKLCKKNNKEALNSLYIKYEKYIYTICYNYTHSREDSLDLVQEVFIKILKNIVKFDENRPLLPWIKRITINTCLNFKRQKKPIISLDEVVTDSGQLLKDAIASQFNLEDFILFQDTSEIINEEIAKIEDRFRMPLILRHKHEMTYEEIASALEVPLGTVKTNIYRARKLLKERLTQRGLWGVAQ
jgi:RNA polymerase sigma-70 factor (ECF subfamily)